ncbi:kinase-like protein [Polyplosphaeria fusca]|uniref:Kinase-like protein n=1 Tax=Polyplosphaeria fusca TaxID=682080 RepID=A0A9P4V8Y3_9PLEO|nr:kinase-like protein [Polyplosphaeria fusca]
MALFTGVQSLRLRSLQSSSSPGLVSMAADPFYGGSGIIDVFKKKLPPHSSHPNFANLTLLVFEAVLEVVCVSLPGYIVARMGMFDAENQKFVANLNTQLFTPFFTKLASQLTAEKLVELGVIPFIFVVQLIISYIAALAISRVCKFKKRGKNFVVAMAVFGNSNSLPISLVISLSKTLSGLHWDRVPGDNDNEVAARGILYLLIFQQLGQLVRWTWGFNVLLAPADTYKDEDEGAIGSIERGEYSDEEAEALLHDDSHSDYESGNITPEYRRTYATSTSSGSSTSDSSSIHREDVSSAEVFPTPTNGNAVAKGPGNVTNARVNGDTENGEVLPYKTDNLPTGRKGWLPRLNRVFGRFFQSLSDGIARTARRTFHTFPPWLQRTLAKMHSVSCKFLAGLWEFMNPPLWAMLVAIVIASIPQLQHLFFDPGTFVSNSITRAVSQSGQVAVPLILVVLGANLARNTLPKEDASSTEDAAVEKKLVIASLVSRMLIPTIVMAPILAITAKFVPVSILDDPIFVIVCFLLTGAPSALQLAQICQINNVYMGAMSSILFQSYVVWILPSTGQPQNPAAPSSESLSSKPTRSSTIDSAASPRSGTPKAVTINDEPETISPLILCKNKELDPNDSFDLDKSAKQYRASMSRKRLSGRPSVERLASSAKQNIMGHPSLSSLVSDDSDISNTSPQHHHIHESLIKQVQSWLKHEKTRRAGRRARRKAMTKDIPEDASAVDDEHAISDQVEGASSSSRDRRASDSSEGSVALDHLAKILEKSLSMKLGDESAQKRRSSRKLSTIMKRQSTVSDDTDYFEGVDPFVPSCEAVLDNSKTLAYGGGAPETVADSGASMRSTHCKDKEAWATFKHEIVRLSHTLKLKGWRRVPLEQSNEIDVERLSGALTNAVYVVSPPRDIPSQQDNESGPPAPKNPPPKLLLRIYGPQVEHLIDREAELQILRRLARKRIGPRLLGTFTNGRFEEFLHAITLTAKDIRMPDTSKQIAKRMRELHEGIDLLPKEQSDGPFVWRNWDKWVDRCEQVVTWLDEQIVKTGDTASLPPSESWKQRGYVCGVPWPVFRHTVDKYRKWLEEQYGGADKVNERLVFAHNDTQYGNILRLTPAGESPLMLPANEHKQLVVIDFEYANANLPGLEFANHFTEWCYNYHDPDTCFRCNTSYYPTPEEQRRFIRAYLTHNPTFKAPGRASQPPTPYLGPLGPLPTSGSTTALAACTKPTTISSFMLDSRAPPGEKYSHQEQEARVEQETEEETKRLMAEASLWRLANSAQWVAWGIVQAHVPGLPEEAKEKGREEKGDDTNKQGQELESATAEMAAEAEKEKEGDDEDGEEQEAEFDYLAYAQERAMFMWGDAVRLGIIKAEELPERVQKAVKYVEN